MEASDGNGNPGFPERSCDVERAGVLVGLNADERNNKLTASPIVELHRLVWWWQLFRQSRLERC